MLEHACGDPIRVVPVVLAVRDELGREATPPRGLAGRVDALLLSLADGSAADASPAGASPADAAPAKTTAAGTASKEVAADAAVSTGAAEADAAPAKATQGRTGGNGPSQGKTHGRSQASATGRGGKHKPTGAPGRAVPGGRHIDRAGRLLRHVLQLAPDAILTVRASGRIGMWNRAGAMITGRRRRDLVAHGVGSLFRDAESYEELVAELDGSGFLDPRETVLLRADRVEVPVRVFGARLDGPPTGRGDPDRYLLFVHDLTEVHRIRRRLIETEKLSAMAKIAGSVAHEFRNPLNSLFLSADLLEDELSGLDAAGEAIAPTLAAIREEIERLNQIITHYLALSKVESREPETIDLGETVKAFAEEWRERDTGQDIELKVSVSKGDLAVQADSGQVRRVLVNLVENAFDALAGAAEDGEDRPRGRIVTLKVRPMRRTVKLTVKDNGPGIPEEQRDRVFEPFFTSKSRGSGLGLYLVREIVLSHGGAISLPGNGGRGTAVAMHWPRPDGVQA